MTRENARRALEAAGCRLIQSGPLGLAVRRAGTVSSAGDRWVRSNIGGVWREEEWRLGSGSGIAGNSGQWWLRPVSTYAGRVSYGPFTSMRALTAFARRWREFDEPAPGPAEEERS